MTSKANDGTVKDGDIVICPNCGAEGRYDVYDNVLNKYNDSVWFDVFISEWACYNCWLKDIRMGFI